MFDYVEYLVAGFMDGEECASFSTLEAAKAFIDAQGYPGNYTILKLAGMASFDGDTTTISNVYLAEAISYIIVED